MIENTGIYSPFAMNFGGGPPYGHGVPPYTNAPPYGYATAVPGMFPPMTAVPGMPVGQPLPASYPQGQGPLAGMQARRGENGLFEAPEPEGPEAHGTFLTRFSSSFIGEHSALLLNLFTHVSACQNLNH